MTETPPMVVDREIYEQVLKDPLYGRRAKIAVEIGRLIVRTGGKSCKNTE